jgi:hypothetical protein
MTSQKMAGSQRSTLLRARILTKGSYIASSRHSSKWCPTSSKCPLSFHNKSLGGQVFCFWLYTKRRSWSTCDFSAWTSNPHLVVMLGEHLQCYAGTSAQITLDLPVCSPVGCRIESCKEARFFSIFPRIRSIPAVVIELPPPLLFGYPQGTYARLTSNLSRSGERIGAVLF